MDRSKWEYKKLKDICVSIDDGDWIESQDQSSEGIRLIQTGNIGVGEYIDKSDKSKYISEETFGRLKCKEIYGGDCLVSRLPDPIGRACILPMMSDRMITAVDCSIVRFKDIVVPGYFVHYTKSRKYNSDISKFATGATRKRISRKNLEGIVIPMPSSELQHRIVAELDCLNEMIAVKQEQLTEFDKLAQSIFYDMFGDPITNDKGWPTKTIGELSTFYNGKAHEGCIDDNGTYIVVNAKYIASKGEIAKRTNKQLLPLLKDDIVMVMSDVPNGKALARCMLVNENDRYSLNQRICAFRQYEQNPLFLLNILNRNSFFLAFNDGNGQTNLRKNDVLNCPILLPPLVLQQQFAEQISAIEAQKELVKQSIAETQALLDYTMDKYFGYD